MHTCVVFVLLPVAFFSACPNLVIGAAANKSGFLIRYILTPDDVYIG
jgi:hypothetical protein